MPGILIRGLKAKTIARLKDRARRNGRSLQSEAKLLLEQSAGSGDVASMLDRWTKRFEKRPIFVQRGSLDSARTARDEIPSRRCQRSGGRVL